MTDQEKPSEPDDPFADLNTDEKNWAISAESTLGGLDAIIDSSRSHPNMGEIGVVIALGKKDGAATSSIWIETAKQWSFLDIARALAGLCGTFPEIARRSIHEGTHSERKDGK